ncbi:hypothetical protein FRC03_011161 [Tulasnella sp. 419]|nr:hypothetical protein FRC02_004443 [Tulasnella sp. 418]KAG8970143.1 hypothetical protein FRC03_011161 [Tulasnella sp. 419]
MSQSSEREQPLYAWIISLNREPTPEEYAICLRCLDNDSFEKINKISRRDDAWRSLLGRLIPQIVMKQRQVPRHLWSIQTTKAGKPYIDAPTEDKHLGYNIAHNNSLVAMAFSLGRKHKVWNIGIDVIKISMPPDIDLGDYIESFSHKLTSLEKTYLDSEQGKEVVLRRLYILWTIKESYIKALGQPPGFDFSRIEVRMPEEEIWVDRKLLTGWEFRLFKANVGVMRGGERGSIFRGFEGLVLPAPVLQEESYQCCMTIYRGSSLGNKCVFKWSDTVKELDKYLRFVTIDAMVNAAKHLSADGHGRGREIVTEKELREKEDRDKQRVARSRDISSSRPTSTSVQREHRVAAA